MPKGRAKQEATSSVNRSTPLPGLGDARKRRGLTQRELAALARTGPATVSDLEKGHRGAYPSTVKRLCRALGVTPSDLMAKGHPSEREHSCR